jgi:hypothetical protein
LTGEFISTCCGQTQTFIPTSVCTAAGGTVYGPPDTGSLQKCVAKGVYRWTRIGPGVSGTAAADACAEASLGYGSAIDTVSGNCYVAGYFSRVPQTTPVVSPATCTALGGFNWGVYNADECWVPVTVLSSADFSGNNIYSASDVTPADREGFATICASAGGVYDAGNEMCYSTEYLSGTRETQDDCETIGGWWSGVPAGDTSGLSPQGLCALNSPKVTLEIGANAGDYDEAGKKWCTDTLCGDATYGSTGGVSCGVASLDGFRAAVSGADFSCPGAEDDGGDGNSGGEMGPATTAQCAAAVWVSSLMGATLMPFWL